MFAGAARRLAVRRAIRHASTVNSKPRSTVVAKPAVKTGSDRGRGQGSGSGPVSGQGDGEDSAARVARLRALPLTLMVVTAFAISVYGGTLVVSTMRGSPEPGTGPTTQSQLTQVYDRTAKSFDADVNMAERLMGITTWRKILARGCKGHVLEVSCGTARNLAFYPFGLNDSMQSLTMADLSAEMIEQGKAKWYTLTATRGLLGPHEGIPVRFWKGDVKGDMPPPPADQASKKVPAGYDTIIQSMGLCSTDEPVELLQNLARHLNPQNPDARILLLEHGRSWAEWLNRILDAQAAMHAAKHGCWWSRDIGQIVEQSGLEIVWQKRKHLGTTWIYELKPASKAQQAREETRNEGHVAGIRGIAQSESQTTVETATFSDAGSMAPSKSSLGDWLPRWTYEKICR